MTYLKRVALGVNQCINTLLGGYPDETLSSRAHRQHMRGRSAMRHLINRVFFWQVDHCMASYQAELDRHQYPDAYRDDREG